MSDTTIPAATWPAPVPPPPAPAPRRPRRIGRSLILVGLVLTVVGLAASTIGGADGGATAKNQATAIDLCQKNLSSHAAVPVTFHIDPLVAHKDGVYTISGGVDVGEKPTGYSCDVAEQGDKLQVTSADFDD